MKKNILLFLLLSYSLLSCDDSPPTDQPISKIADTRILGANIQIDTPSQTKDSLPTLDWEDSIAVLEKWANQLHTDCNTIEDEKKIYIENIPFTSFLGAAIDEGVLEIIAVGDFTRINADYLKGYPKGVKRFLLRDKQLFCIEIIQLEEVVNESGTSINEKISHLFYYDNNHLIKVIHQETKAVIKAETERLANENLADWAIIQNIYEQSY